MIKNFANPIEELTTRQLKEIFEGKLKYWSQVYEEGPETRIRIIQRTWNQNIRQSFEQHLNIENHKNLRAKIVDKEEHTFKALNGNIYSISYVSMGPALKARKDGYGDGRNFELAACTDDPHGNFTAIGHQDFLKHDRTYR